jgi:hypothetical protein
LAAHHGPKMFRRGESGGAELLQIGVLRTRRLPQPDSPANSPYASILG